MSHTRNFAELGLPDIDSAPQEYQTPDLVNDTGTSPQSRSTSATSSYKDLEDGDSDSADDDAGADGSGAVSRLDRLSLQVPAARARFSRSKVDARRADFSDRLHPHRNSNKPRNRSYVVTSRRRRRPDGGEEFASGRFSDVGEGESGESGEDDEEGEGRGTVEQRIARLKREVEEVQNELSKGEAASDKGSSSGARETLEQLGGILKTLETRSTLRRAASSAKRVPIPPPEPHPKSPPPASSSAADTTQTLQKAAALESRLASLESALGVASLSHLASSSSTRPPTKSVLASLSLLETQLSIISATTAPSLEALSEQIAKLSQQADGLVDARNGNKAAASAVPSRGNITATASRPHSMLQGAFSSQQQEANSESTAAASSSPSSTAVGAQPDAATAARVAALHAALPQVERLAPILPAVVDRLRSLRALHAQAGDAGALLAEVEAAQARLAGELERWRGGLERAGAAVEQAGDSSRANREAVEAWVRQLEERAERLA